MTSSHVGIGSGDHHVLAVRGWFGSSRGSGSLPDYLDPSTYTYVFMDLRGYGDRKQVPGELTMEEAAADAIALADELEQTWLVFFPEAEMTIGPDAGHYPMFESPVSLATSIEEFLGRQ